MPPAAGCFELVMEIAARRSLCFEKRSCFYHLRYDPQMHTPVAQPAVLTRQYLCAGRSVYRRCRQAVLSFPHKRKLAAVCALGAWHWLALPTKCFLGQPRSSFCSLSGHKACYDAAFFLMCLYRPRWPVGGFLCARSFLVRRVRAAGAPAPLPGRPRPAGTLPPLPSISARAYEHHSLHVLLSPLCTRLSLGILRRQLGRRVTIAARCRWMPGSTS